MVFLVFFVFCMVWANPNAFVPCVCFCVWAFQPVLASCRSANAQPMDRAQRPPGHICCIVCIIWPHKRLRICHLTQRRVYKPYPPPGTWYPHPSGGPGPRIPYGMACSQSEWYLAALWEIPSPIRASQSCSMAHFSWF